MTTAADMERVRGQCVNCDRPLATTQDAKDIPPGKGEHLCWGACEPEDWRARALKAEAERNEARAEVERFRSAVREKERLELEALRELDEAQAKVERLRAELRGHGFGECDVQACNCGGWHARQSVADRLRTVAERQREADIDHCYVWLGHANVGVPLDQFMRDTPLVTEGER